MKPSLFLFISVIFLASCENKLKEENAILTNKLDSTVIVAFNNMKFFQEKDILIHKLVAVQQARADSLQALLDECRAKKK